MFSITHKKLGGIDAKKKDVSKKMYCLVLTGICDEYTLHCNFGYYDTFDLLIILNHSSKNISLSASLKRNRIFNRKKIRNKNVKSNVFAHFVHSQN